MKIISLHGCRLASAIMAKKGRYLALVEVQGQPINGHLGSLVVLLAEREQSDAEAQVLRLLLKVILGRWRHAQPTVVM